MGRYDCLLDPGGHQDISKTGCIVGYPGDIVRDRSIRPGLGELQAMGSEGRDDHLDCGDSARDGPFQLFCEFCTARGVLTKLFRSKNDKGLSKANRYLYKRAAGN
jgi:hypothetical protein